MKTTSLVVFSAIAVLTSALSAASGKPQKVPDVSGIPFFTMIKRGHVPQMARGLTGALLFNDMQKTEILAAYDEIFNNATVQAAKRLPKGDPKVTEADRESARQTLEKADTQFHERLEGLLSKERKELIKKINHAYEEACLAFKPEGKGSKDPSLMQAAVNDAFLKALDEILTTEQKQGMDLAAAEEARRAANAQKVGKPK